MNGLLNIDIPLAVVGCDFRIASTPLRERLVSTDEQRAELFQAIRRIDPEAGFAALETCNRVEWIVSTENPRWMAELLKARVIALWNEAFAGRAEIPEPLALVPAYLEPEHDILGGIQMREQRVGLEHHGNPALGGWCVGDVRAADQHPPAIHRIETGDHPQGRRLAAAGRSEQDQKTPLFRAQGDILDGNRITPTLGDADQLDSGHGRSPAPGPARNAMSRPTLHRSRSTRKNDVRFSTLYVNNMSDR